MAAGTAWIEYSGGLPSAMVNALSSHSTDQYDGAGREAGAGGSMYYRARYCSPGMQRFISQYLLRFGGGNVYLYAYGGNSPTRWVDPTGLMF